MDGLTELLKNMKELRDQILRCDYDYYVLSNPMVSDSEYDGLKVTLKHYEAALVEVVQHFELEQ